MINFKDLPFVIFSSLTEDKGHLLLDDNFWFKNLILIDERTKIFTSETSVKNLSAQFNEYNNSFISFKEFPILKKINSRLHLFAKILFCPPIKNSTIVIQGFEELSLILFLYRIRNWNNKIILVLTNNVSPERIKKSKWLLQFLLRYIFNKCNNVFYHTEFEYKLIQQIVKDSSQLLKIKKLKYHLIGLFYSNLTKVDSSNYISFFGPILPSKPIDDICKLILADSNSQFQYRFVNIDLISEKIILKKLDNRTNISFHNEYLGYEEYLNLIKSSKFVFLPHNSLFEGKLSGILSDCISIGTPVISDNIEPVLELFKKYGSMGYIFNYSKDSNWPNKFLELQSNNSCDKFVVSIENCRNNHSNTIIINEFLHSIKNNS